MPRWIHLEDNTWSQLVDATPEQERELYNGLKIRSKSYAFDPRFRAGIWDGWEHFYNFSNKSLPTGLVPFARDIGFEFEETCYAVNPKPEWSGTPKLTGIEAFTGYQQESFDRVKAGSRRGIFDHMTGAGKSVLLAGLLQDAKELTAVVTVPTCDLLQQLQESLEAMLGEKVGALGCKSTRIERVTVAYVGFLRDFVKSPYVKDLAASCQMLVSDELQMVTPSLYPFYRLCRNAYYRYGFSGSFFNNDPVRIFKTAGFFGGVITKVTDKELNESGRGVPPTFMFYEFPVAKVTDDATYNEAYSRHIVQNRQYNLYFTNLLHQYYDEGKTILILIKRIQHAKLLKDILREQFIDSEEYTGQVDTEKRRTMRKEFKSGKIPVLIATEQTFGVGVDIPRIEVMLNLGGGLSDDKSIQKYGRGLRSFEDKSGVTIIEPYITGNRWFQKHSRARFKIAESYSTGIVKLLPFNPIS